VIAMAKWYEASVSSSKQSRCDWWQTRPFSKPGCLRINLMLEAGGRLSITPGSEAWVRGRPKPLPSTAGLIGGVGGASCRHRCRARRPQTGLTQLECSNDSLPWRQVGFGVLVQLQAGEELPQLRIVWPSGRAAVDQLFRKLKLSRLPRTTWASRV